MTTLLDQKRRDTQTSVVERAADHGLPGTHRRTVGGAASSPGQIPCDTPCAGDHLGVGPPPRDTQRATADASYVDLLFWAATVDDLEKARIAAENRLRSWEAEPSNEFDTAKALAGDPKLAAAQATVDGLRLLEASAIKSLEKAMKQHPLGAFVKATPGLGLKQTARLLAAIGPVTHYEDDEGVHERTVGGLWRYCGMDVRDGEAPRHRKGEFGGWNDEARMRARLVAESCIKARTSPYRDVYDRAREKYADAKHRVPCVRCGPAGKPAQPRSDLSDGHKHARALRIVAKSVLRDLWRVANGYPPKF
jgi:hypothetical protein